MVFFSEGTFPKLSEALHNDVVESSVKFVTIQRSLAWPLHQHDTHKRLKVFVGFRPAAVVSWGILGAPVIGPGPKPHAFREAPSEEGAQAAWPPHPVRRPDRAKPLVPA